MHQQKLCQIVRQRPCHAHPAFTFAPEPTETEIQRLNKTQQQTRICKELGLKCSHKLSFLSLPTKARHLIYIKAGLLYQEDIWLHKRTGDRSYGLVEFDPDEQDYHTTLNLLLTCWFVYQDAFNILYSENKFHVNFPIAKSLGSIRHLTSKALATMTHLSITMNQISCGQECCRSNPINQSGICERSRQWQFHCGCSRPSIDDVALAEWIVTAPYISAHISPSQLHMNFIFDTRNLDAAQSVLLPFFSMPRLVSCNIRIARELDARLIALATKATTVTTSRISQLPSPFIFYQLPSEVQFIILGFTDLVTPQREVEVDVSGFYKARRLYGGIWEHVHDETTTREEWSRLNMRCHQDNGQCLCRRYHSTSSNCHCWIPPTSLFLVCKAMRELALETFFSQNRFVVMPIGGQNEFHSQKRLDQFPARSFLQRIQAANALRFLKRVDILLPAFETGYLRPTKLAFLDWQNMLQEICSRGIQLTRLTITIFISLAGFLRQIATGSGNDLMVYYRRFCEPLQDLGLRKFYVHVVQSRFPWISPNHPIPMTTMNEAQAMKEVQDLVLLTERNLEQLVMGNDYLSDHVELSARRHFELECLEFASIS
jgi:hypothetical protein